MTGDERIVNLLIKNGANVSALNKDKWIPLHFAAQSGNSIFDLRKCLLLSLNALIRFVNGNLGSEKVADLLIKNGAIVDARNDEGDSPLIIAANGGNFHRDCKCFGFICRRYKFPSYKFILKYEHYDEHSFWLGNGAVAELLIGYGADVNLTNNVGLTALHQAAEHGELHKMMNSLFQTVNPNYWYWKIQNFDKFEIEKVESLFR